MRKICLTLVGIFLLFLHGFSQFSAPAETYHPKPLRLEEINLVSSYYSQQGNHSAVTGGIGNEQVTDLSNGLDVKFVGWDPGQRKHSLNLGFGIDHHTAASSAYVSKTGASNTGGTRVYPSLSWTVENKKGNSFGIGTYYSTEYNYKSFGLEVKTARKLGSNTEVNAKVSGFFDQVKMIYPSELVPNTEVVQTTPTTYTTASGRTVRSGGGSSYAEENSIPSESRHTFTASLSLAQIVNTRMQFSLTADAVAQNGYLGLPFHRVYFSDESVHVENLPSTRAKLPLGVRFSYFISDRLIARAFYRYYLDNWGIKAHTAELELPVKISSFFSISPFYRYYTQTASTYFAAYGVHTAAEQYYSSNYSLSALSSNFFGMGMHLAPPKGILTQHFSSADIRFGHYTQTTGLYANVLSFALTFK